MQLVPPSRDDVNQAEFYLTIKITKTFSLFNHTRRFSVTFYAFSMLQENQVQNFREASGAL